MAINVRRPKKGWLSRLKATRDGGQMKASTYVSSIAAKPQSYSYNAIDLVTICFILQHILKKAGPRIRIVPGDINGCRTAL
jgi:hypothetical protein